VTREPSFLRGCDFCDIARGATEEVELVCQAENWVAFFPLNPATPGHTLVIPRTHVADLWQAEPSLAADLAGAVQRVGLAIDKALEPDGMNLITSAGSAAEQTVFHLHLHVVPRWSKDGFGKIWPTGETYSDPTLDAVAASIRDAC
jgi:histidine triad (HIT) family protein